MLLHCLFWNLLLGWSSLQSMTSTLLGTRTRSTTSAIGSWTNCCLTLCPGDGSAFFFGYLKRGRHHETTLLVKKKTRQSSHKDVFRIRMYLYVQCWKQICASYTRYVYVYIYIYTHITYLYIWPPTPPNTPQVPELDNVGPWGLAQWWKDPSDWHSAMSNLCFFLAASGGKMESWHQLRQSWMGSLIL